MNKCFWMVANFLLRLAKKTKLTYNEINVILYYLIIPLTWCILLDLIIKLPIFTIGFILLWAIIFIVVGKSFSQWCDRIFVLSQQFIKLFGEIQLNDEGLEKIKSFLLLNHNRKID